MAQRAEVIVYAISTTLVDTHTKGDENLKAMAEATGGRVFLSTKLDDVVAAFADIQEELRSQYSVSYRPEGFIANDQFRPIQILADSKKYKVRTKKGYYVPKQ
jgi:Ca-activated chloride channel family protein